MGKRLLTLLLTAVILTSCGGGSHEESGLHFKSQSLINGKNYDFYFDYDDSYFDSPATTFNKPLMTYSFGLSIAADDSNTITKFLTESGFGNFSYPKYYDEETTPNGIGYTFASKEIGENNVIALTVRGSNYHREWISNLMVGETGDHEGFKNASTIVESDLMDYITTNGFDLENTKILLTGYSRGGGVANLLANRLLKEDFIAEERFYVYTFEAPASVADENVEECSNVFNILNSADPVPMIPPTAYGLTRCGTDIDIYNSSVDKLCKKFDKDLVLPEFTPLDGQYSKDTEIPSYIIGRILKYEDDGSTHLSISDRAGYYNNLQSKITYLLSVFFEVPSSVLNAIMDDFSKRGSSGLITYFLSENGLYNYLEPFISGQVVYDEDTLKDALETLRKEVFGGAFNFVLVYVSNFSPLLRMIYMHTADVNYLLIKNYKGS